MQALTPHVYWAQRHGDIYLRVEISDAQVKPDELNASSLSSVATLYYFACGCQGRVA